MIITAYTDGACKGNPGLSGCACVLECGNLRKTFHRFLGEGTNNSAELEAIKLALTKIKLKNVPVKVYTDSQYAIGCLTRNWKLKKNVELILSIRKLLKQYDNVTFHWIKGKKHLIVLSCM